VSNLLDTRLPQLTAYGEVVKNLGAEHALIVHCCGLDELSAVGPADAIEVRKGQPTRRFKIDPLEIGIPRCDIKDLAGGEPEENAAILRSVFAGGDRARGAIADTIALNAGAALYVYGLAGSIQEGYRLAIDKLRSGHVLGVLDRFASVSTCLEKGEPITKAPKLAPAPAPLPAP
jgi:anthranilate phosphoribosyltransferase